MSKVKEIKILHFDSVISLSLVTESLEKKRSLYVMRLESLDETMLLRKCNPLSDFSSIKESLFIIRRIREQANDEPLPLNEAENIQALRVNYNQNFILQHMVSKKFLSKDKMSGNNNYKLKLVEKENLAVPFTFRKIVDTRSSITYITYNQIIYLSVYVKEKAQYYYVNQLGSKKDYVEYLDLVIEKDFNNKFTIINQNCFGQDDGYLYSGQLVNITFQEKQQLNEKNYMIGVECQKEVKTGELISLKEEVKEDIENFIKDNGQQGNDLSELKMENKNESGIKSVKSYNVKNELFKHINHNTFWIIEEEFYNQQSKVERKPILTETYLRIKNPLLGLYLKISKKPQIEGVVIQNDEYEFELVEEKNLTNNSMFYSNFQIFHYSINAENKSLSNRGKYVIKSVFKEFKPNDIDSRLNIDSINSYFEPISLYPDADDKIGVRKGEEFVFEIRKIDIYKANEAIYLKRIIEHLDYLVKSYNKKFYNQSNVIDVISKHITFFTNYLMNLDYSFKDVNLETNYPIPERQNLLRKYKILDIITQIILYFLPTVRQNRSKYESNDSKNESNSGLQVLMKQILNFLTNLSQNNEKIKQEIFCTMKNILELCEYLFQKDRSALLDFIFIILKGSTALQECVLGSDIMLINSFKSRKKNLSILERENLIHIDKIFSYLETSINYLIFYKNIITFDKVTYKKDSIKLKIKEHMEKIINDFESNKKKRNYKKILYIIIQKIKILLGERKKKIDRMKEKTQEDEITLHNIKQIQIFLNFFQKFDLNSSLFLNELFFSELTKNKIGVKTNQDYLDKKLNFLIQGNIKPEKVVGDLDIDVKSQLAPLFPLHFYNKFFPKIEEKDEKAILDGKENLLNIEILSDDDSNEEKNDDNIIHTSRINPQIKKSKNNKKMNFDDSNSSNDSSNSQNDENNKNIIESIELNKYLCIVYSIYQFCINQYFDAIYKVIKNCKNILVNYETFGNFDLIKEYLTFIRINLLKKVVFLNNPIISIIYNNVMSEPTLIENKFTFGEKDEGLNNTGLGSEEIILIKFLFYFCKTYNKINFQLRKLSIFHEIQKLSISNEMISYEIIFFKIIQELNENRQNIIALYQQLNTEKDQLIASGKFHISGIKAFLIQQRISFVTKLLGKYDIGNYFDKIIYIKNEELLSHIKSSSYEFHNIKEQIEKIHNEFDSNNPSEEKQGNTIYISNIINSLIEVSNQFYTIFENAKKDKDNDNFLYYENNNIDSMLIKEDDSYLRKIQFPDTLHKLIEVINSFSHVEKASLLKLEYCKEILRIFISMTKNYSKFNKLLESEMDIYIYLIHKSLESVKIYTSEKFDDKQNERVILSIIYNSSISFLYLIENSKMKFGDLKKYLTEIFELYYEIYQDLRPKIKVVYQIFYTYLVTRILLYLNRDKAYDFYYYEMFFQKIYPMREMRKRTLYCINEINSHSKETPEEEESEESNSKSSENISSEHLESKIEEDVINDNDIYEQEEKLEFTIFLNFLNIYVIYLNELNSVRQNLTLDKSGVTKFNFKSLNDKIKYVLDSSIKILDDQLKNDKNESFDERNSVAKGQTQLKVLNQLTISGGENSNHNSINPFNDYNSTHVNQNNDIKNDVGIKNLFQDVKNDYEFESVLLESIIYYKLEKKILEIGIVEFKRYKFYYYDTEYIDIILIEKILRGIGIRNKLRDFCEDNPVDIDDNFDDESSSFDNKNEIPLMNILIKNLQNYDIVIHYHSFEKAYYQILHEEFIKNDMVNFIECLIKKFDKNDLENIYAMKFFNYIKMNEMYPQEKQLLKKRNDTLSLVETLLKVDSDSYSKGRLYQFNDIKPIYNNKKKSVDINKLFNHIMYLYPQNSKKLTILFYMISFKILHKSCLEIGNNNSGIETIIKFDDIINGLISLFKRQINQTIILDKELFLTVLSTISIMLNMIKNEQSNFVIKNPELFKNLFSSFDFILDYLAKDLKSILKFMMKPENSKITDKSIKKQEKLKSFINFLKTIFMYNNIGDSSLLSQLKSYNSKIVEQIIKLLFVLLKFNFNNSISSILLLLEFLNNFIDGPDIDNLHLLFSQGYLELMEYVIKNVDYYKLFIEFINKDNLYDIIDNMIEIEYKIMKIFFIYFNIAFHDKKDLNNYIKVRKFYDENFEFITHKLKRIYYISQKEMEFKKFDIDKMLRYNNNNDFYSDEDLYIRAGITDDNIDVENDDKNDYNEEFNDFESNNISVKSNKFCLIKFEIILIYYTLYIFQREIMYENYFDIKSSKITFFNRIYNFIYSFIMFIFNFLITPYFIIKYIIRCLGLKKKNTVRLFEQLYDINDKYLKVDEREMMSYMKENVTSVEVTLNDILYKVYFPILSKSKLIKKFSQTYLKVESDQLQNYIYHIMNNYDRINIEATQNLKIDSILELPFIKIIFQNMNLIQTISLLIGIIINLFILMSYSTFTKDDYCDKNNSRINCPYFTYSSGKNKLERTRGTFRALGYVHLILTICLFLNYYLRIFAIELKKSESKFKVKELKKTKKKRIIYGIWRYISSVLIPTVFNSLFNFESLFYILALGFNLIGILLHDFFYGFMLVEVIVRVEVMKNVLLAIYIPWRQIIITLLIFLVIIYYFSLFALSFFPSHFKIIGDTKNFLNTFMRVFDQGFKQDGGVGTYLDKTLEPHYVPYTYRNYIGIRFWYDNIFYYIAITTIFQMFLSIINNYFSSQREDQEKFAEIVERECIICGIEREALEKMYSNHKSAFEIHTNHDHNISDYICYLNYIQILTKRDIVEENVWKLHLGNNYFFLPKNICFKLKERRILEHSGHHQEN